jgi:ketosteroid isomerase-like protein
MTNHAGMALMQALALIRAPRSVRPGANEKLPDGMLALIKIVAGEERALAEAQETSGESADTVREAASFYIQQVMFNSDSNSYRVLGVDPDASDERLRENYRWLARWLHPDRNPDQWEVVYAERVNKAWQDLRTTERRLRYEQARQDADQSVNSDRASGPMTLRPMYVDTAESRLNLRWLPTAIFAGLGVSAVAVVALFYVVRMAETSPPVDAPRPTITEVKPELVPQVQAQSLPPPLPQPELQSQPPPQPHELASTTLAADVEPNSPGPAAAIESPPPVALPPPVAPERTAMAPVPPPRPVATKVAPVAPPPRHVEAMVASAPVVAPKPAPPALPAPSAREAPRSRRNSRTETVAVANRERPRMQTTVTAPAAPAVDAEPIRQPIAQHPALDSRDANRLLSHFSRAYEDGNLAGMRAMFTSDIRGPRGGMGAILADYDRVFASSRDRSLAVRDVSWFANGDTLTIIASFEATVTSARGGRPRKTHGDIRLDLRREDEQWRIFRLLHDERPG